MGREMEDRLGITDCDVSVAMTRATRASKYAQPFVLDVLLQRPYILGNDRRLFC